MAPLVERNDCWVAQFLLETCGTSACGSRCPPMPPPTTFGPAGDQDAIAAYLFRCAETGRHAVSKDRSGRNLPSTGSAGSWRFVQEVAVGVRDPLPIPGDPEPVLRGLVDAGYYVWPQGTNPHGTSQ